MVYLKNMFEIEGALITLEEEYSHRIVYSNLKAGSLLSQILVDISRKIQFETSVEIAHKARNVNPRLIIDYIYENFDKPLNNTELGKQFGYHPNYVSALVKSYTGLPLHQYLNHIRIARATNYLDMGIISIHDIAQKCGFESQNYFSRYFKKITGSSPSEYMRQP